MLFLILDPGLECPEHAHCVTDHCECEPGYTPTNTVDGLSCICKLNF